MKKYLLLCPLFFIFLLTSCGNYTPPAWVKPGAGQDEYQQARYKCLQNSQQRVSRSNQYSYDNKIITNDELFNACMGAQGWRLTSTNNRKASKQNNSQREANPQATVSASPQTCKSAWNALVDANQVDNVKILVKNDCNRIHTNGWKPGQGISNTFVCSPPWDSLELASMLEQAKALVKLDCTVMYKNGF